MQAGNQDEPSQRAWTSFKWLHSSVGRFHASCVIRLSEQREVQKVTASSYTLSSSILYDLACSSPQPSFLNYFKHAFAREKKERRSKTSRRLFFVVNRFAARQSQVLAPRKPTSVPTSGACLFIWRLTRRLLYLTLDSPSATHLDDRSSPPYPLDSYPDSPLLTRRSNCQYRTCVFHSLGQLACEDFGEDFVAPAIRVLCVNQQFHHPMHSLHEGVEKRRLASCLLVSIVGPFGLYLWPSYARRDSIR